MNVINEVITGAEREDRYFYSSELEQVKEFSLSAARRVQIAQILTDSHSRIIKQAGDQLFQRNPYIVSPGGNAYGSEKTAQCLRDLDFFLRLAIYGIVAGNTSLIDERVEGLIETYRALGTPIDVVAEGVSILSKISCSLLSSEQLPSKQIAEANFYFEYVLQSLGDQEEITASTIESPNLLNDKHMRIWERGDRIIAFASGSAFLGGLIAQIPGAMVGAFLGGMFGLLRQDKTTNSAENS